MRGDFIIAVTSRPELITENAGMMVVNPHKLLSIEMPHVDVVVNCAFPRSGFEAEVARGLEWTRKFIACLGKMEVDSFINISSQSVYCGRRAAAAIEHDEVLPDSAYGLGKYAGELLCNASLSSIPHTNIRLASLLDSDLDQRFVNKMIRNIVSHKCISASIGRQCYGFLDACDAAEGIVDLAHSSPERWSEVYNMGPWEKGYEFRRVVDMIVAAGVAQGFEPSVQYLSSGDDSSSALDSSLIFKDIGWQSKRSLYQTIVNIYNSIISD